MIQINIEKLNKPQKQTLKGLFGFGAILFSNGLWIVSIICIPGMWIFGIPLIIFNVFILYQAVNCWINNTEDE